MPSLSELPSDINIRKLIKAKNSEIDYRATQIDQKHSILFTKRN